MVGFESVSFGETCRSAMAHGRPSATILRSQKVGAWERPEDTIGTAHDGTIQMIDGTSIRPANKLQERK